MPTRQRVGRKRGEGRRPPVHGRRNLDRRCFPKAALFGTTAGIVAARSLRPERLVFAGEPTADREKSKKSDPSKSLQAARCPVTGDNVSKEAFLDYKGGRIYFCCAECIDKFKADKAKYEARANVQLVVTGQVRQIQCPLTGGEFDPEIQVIVGGVQVCLCSEECRDEVKRAAPSKQIGLVFGKGFDKAFAMKRTVDGASGDSLHAETRKLVEYRRMRIERARTAMPGTPDRRRATLGGRDCRVGRRSQPSCNLRQLAVHDR